MMENKDKKKDYIADHYFHITAKANLFDSLMEAGFIKKSHLEYGMKQIDKVDADLLKKEWSENNDSK